MNFKRNFILFLAIISSSASATSITEMTYMSKKTLVLTLCISQNRLVIEEEFRDGQQEIGMYKSAAKAGAEVVRLSKIVMNAENVLSKDHQLDVDDWDSFCGDDFGSTSLKAQE